jgi:hypothetical protein
LPAAAAAHGRFHYRIAFISDRDGNVIGLMQIRPEAAIYREWHKLHRRTQ